MIPLVVLGAEWRLPLTLNHKPLTRSNCVCAIADVRDGGWVRDGRGVRWVHDSDDGTNLITFPVGCFTFHGVILFFYSVFYRV